MKIHSRIFGVAQLLILTLFVLKTSLAHQNCTKNADCGGKKKCCPGVLKLCKETCIDGFSTRVIQGPPTPACNNGKQYKLFTEKMTWFKAMTTCFNDKGILPEVKSKEEAVFLRGTYLGFYIWIGGHSIYWPLKNTDINARIFHWVGSKNVVDFNVLEKFKLNNKNEGTRTGESCLGGYEEANVQWWNDWACHTLFPFICYYPNIQCYA